MSKKAIIFESSGKQNFETMKTLSQNIRLCSCNNHLILAPGEICEVCLGIAPEQSFEEEFQANASEHYDYSYFEALECWYESMEFAA